MKPGKEEEGVIRAGLDVGYVARWKALKKLGQFRRSMGGGERKSGQVIRAQVFRGAGGGASREVSRGRNRKGWI